MDIAIIIGMISVVIVVVVTLRSKSGQEEEIVLTEEFKEILHILDNTIMRAFIAIKRLSLQDMDLKAQLQEMKHRIGEHDAQLNQLYDEMVNLLDEKAAQRKWEERDRIGFK